MPTLNLEEAVESVVGCLEGEVVAGFHDALDLTEELTGIGGALEFHHRACGDHQAQGFFLALGLEGTFSEEVDYGLVLFACVEILHQRGLRVGAEFIHARAVEYDA